MKRQAAPVAAAHVIDNGVDLDEMTLMKGRVTGGTRIPFPMHTRQNASPRQRQHEGADSGGLLRKKPDRPDPLQSVHLPEPDWSARLEMCQWMRRRT